MKSTMKILSIVALCAGMLLPMQTRAATTTIQPTDTLSVGNCYPFGVGGGGAWDPYAGFVYQNVPAFELQVGDTLAFDLGALNDGAAQLDIAMAATTVNGGDVQDATGFITVVTNTQLPANPYGDTITGNFELQFVAEAPFSFAGGGLIIRFSNPSAAYAADTICDGVLVRASSSDVSGNFVERFYRDADGVSTWDIVALDSIGGFQIVNNGLVLQPDGVAGKDAMISEDGPSTNTNFGTATYLTTNNPLIQRGMIEFDVTSIPAGSTINQASLELREFNNCINNENAMEAYEIQAAWDEALVTWNTAPAFGAVPVATNTGEVPGAGCEWLKFDVTAQVQNWIDGVSPNYGLMITGPAGGDAAKLIYSSDWTTASERPILRIDFTPPAAAVAVNTTGCVLSTEDGLFPLLALALLTIGYFVRRRSNNEG